MLKLKEPRAGYSKYWRVRGTYLGRSVDRSTKATDRKTAAKVLKDIKAEIERGGFAEKPKKKQQTGVLTFDEAALRYQRAGHDGQARFIGRLSAYFGKTPLASITQTSIEDAAFDLLPDAKNATRNRAVFTPMSAILRYNGAQLMLRRPDGADGEQRTFWLEPDQAQRLISAAYAYRAEFGLFLMFLLYTGCRLDEALRLEAKHVELREARAFVEKTKNGLPRLVHLPQTLVAALANHPRGLDREGRVFCFHAGGKLTRRLRSVANKAGVTIPSGVAFHAFRHTWGAWMRRYGKLDTTGLVATGAWTTHDAARRYEHAVVSEEAARAEFLPAISVQKAV